MEGGDGEEEVFVLVVVAVLGALGGAGVVALVCFVSGTGCSV